VPIEWTQAEMQSILSTVDIPEGFYDLDELLESIGASIDVDGLTEAQIATAFSGPAAPESLEAARRLAARQARLIAGNLAQTALNSVAEKVRKNIEEGGSFSDLYKKLTEIKGLDANRAATLENFRDELIENGLSGDALAFRVDRMREKLLRDRKKVIAQTEQAMAMGEGANERAVADGAKFKKWITKKDSRVSDMDQSNEAQGWIPVDDNFSSGNQFNPSHPRCRCSVVYRNFPPRQTDKDRAEKASEATAAAKAAPQEETE
jgi:CheY-like chemotaxis protein